MSLSVFIPSYNRVDYLRQAVDSVLAQSFADFRVYVVDNASQDGTPDYCARVPDPRFASVRNEQNLGMRGNWQKCLDLCETEWFAMLEDDNIWEQGFLEQTFRPDKDTVICHSGAYLFSDEHGRIDTRATAWWQTHDTDRCFLEPVEYSIWQTYASQVAASTAIFRTDVARQAGGYRLDITAAQDWSLLSRIGRCGKVLSLREELVGYRIHDSRASVDPLIARQVRRDSQRIAVDNWKWVLSAQGFHERDFTEYVEKIPLGQLYGLLEALSCEKADPDLRKSARELWRIAKKTAGKRPKAVRFFGWLGYDVMDNIWKIKNRV
jgi:glycosyltransferase involved in cell wall biosynthesis